MALNILSHLDNNTLDIAAKVSPIWEELCKSEELWKYKCVDYDVPTIRIYANLADWRKLFERGDALKSNWENGKYRITTFKGHREKYAFFYFINLKKR